MSSTLAVISLFGSSFLSATLLPGNSEIVLVALLTQSRVSPELLVLAATLGNTLGGLTNVIIGRLLPALKPQRGLATALGWLQRFGPAALLLSWVPVVGDLLLSCWQVGCACPGALSRCFCVSERRCVTSFWL